MLSISELIPYSSHISPEIIKIKGGSYLMTFALDGISYTGVNKDIIGARIAQINKFITQLRAPLRYNLYIHSHCIRHESEAHLDDTFIENSFSEKLNTAYIDKKINHFPIIKTSYFISIIYRPIRKIAGFSAYKTTKEQIKIFEEQSFETLNKIKNLVLDFFAEYRVRTLTCFENEQGVVFSEVLQFLSLIINLDNSPVPLMKAQISEYLATSTISVGNNEYIKIDSKGKKQYASILSISEYPRETYAGLLQSVLELPYKMVVSQCFVPIDKAETVTWLKRESRRLESTDDASVSDMQDLDNAIEGVQSDDFILGEFSWSIMLISDSIKELQKQIANTIATLSNCGFVASVNVMAKIHSFYAQLPANLRLQPREAKVSSLNAVHLMPYQVQNHGKAYGNPWGCAIAMFRTINDEIYNFNFHDSDPNSDEYGKLLLGNTVISGQSGTGKTVLLSFLLAQAQRYQSRPKTIIFDKDLGSSVFVKAMGGQYSRIKLGTSTGFNPFMLPNTDQNRTFLEQLIIAILSNDGQAISASDRNQISDAIKQVMSFEDDSLRNISAFANYLPNTSGSIRERLYAWTEGNYSWVFNNQVDNFSLDARIVGIDYTEFLDVKDIRTPILMYLFYRIELMLDGKPTIISLDEAWKPLSDPEFQKFIEKKERTIRKENGLLILATQSPSDFFHGVSSALMAQIATHIYLPNPLANREDYIGKLGLDEKEYKLIKEMRKNSREFLVKTQSSSTHCKLDLKGILEVDVLSGSEIRANHADSLIEKYGSDWLAHYYQTVHSLGD